MGPKISLDANLLKKLLPAILLLAIIYMAFSVRMYSAYRPYYPDIDTYYLFRMSSYVLTHDFHLPKEDTLQYYPTHILKGTEENGVYYLFAGTYALLKNIGMTQESFANFAWWFPALLGALSTIPIYLIGKSIHNRLTGLFAAFFFAVIPGILSRNSAWYVEKEVQAALFILITIYFFIRGIKNASVLSGIVSGLSLFVVATTWGGSEAIYIAFTLFVLLLLLVDKQPKSLIKIYPIVAVLGIILPQPLAYKVGIIDTLSLQYSLLSLSAIAIMLIRSASERYSFAPKEKLRFIVPILYGVGTVLLFIGSFFSTKLAGLIATADQYLFYHPGVISSTVAENIPPGWGDFTNQLGTSYAQGMLPSLTALIKSHIFDVWFLGFVGIFILLYKIYEKRDAEFWLANLASVIMMYSFRAFLTAGDAASKDTMQVFFVMSFFSLILFVSRKNIFGSLVLTFLFVAMLGSMSLIRLIFLIGPFIGIMAAYALSNIIDASNRIKLFQSEDGSKINVFSAAGIFSIGLLLFVNFAAGSVMAHGMGALYNQNWDGAMKYMKTQTPNDSVILSWWDYGYWFQLMGERATNLDGSNAIASRNIPTAQFFTGMMNETEQEFFLQKMGTTHVLIDASMIGKYAAMSKIANYGNKIDSYLQFGAAGSQEQGNTTILAYSASPYFLLVPVNQDGKLAGNIVISVPDGEAYISSICSEKGIFPLNPPKNKRIIDGCVFLGQGYALFASGEVANSVFTKLFFMDGLGIPYLDKVFDNGEVKIYKVNDKVKHETREELLPWWNKDYDGSGLRVYDGEKRVYQKVE